MKQRMARVLFLIAAMLFLGAGHVSANEKIAGEYLVKYKDDAFIAMSSVRSMGFVRILDHNPYGQLLKVKVNSVDEVRTLANLLADPNVAYVVPNVKIHAFTAPVDVQALKEQWSIKKVRAEEAWKRAGNKGSRNVVIAVIDTGVDYNHESLKPNMVAGYDFKENDADPYDKTSAQNPGHGTHCAGIIGGTGLVDGGIVGISPEVSLMPLRFLGEDGSGDLNAAIKAMDYAVQKGAKVISASWGAAIGRAQAQPLVDAVKRADDAGVIFVVAAANDGKSNDKTEVYPANAGFPNTISVAASGPNDEKPSWSNYGRRTVHLAAPGLDIMSTLPANKYGKLSGTSMATPLVSGLVAFLLSQDSTLTGAQVRALLQTTGVKASIETACNCRVDAFEAVDTLLAKKMFVTPAAGTIAVGETLQFSGTNGQAPFKFALDNGSVGSISATGLFTASAKGETTVSVTDANGQVAKSLTVYVGDTGGGGSNPGDPGMPGECPLGDPMICELICQFQPDLPWCNK